MDPTIPKERGSGLRAGARDIHLRHGEVGMGGIRLFSFFC